jgi:ribosomal protein L14E/L6E/L27E
MTARPAARRKCLKINYLRNLSFRCRANSGKSAKIKKIKNEKIPCFLAVLWYSGSMKKKSTEEKALTEIAKIALFEANAKTGLKKIQKILENFQKTR